MTQQGQPNGGAQDDQSEGWPESNFPADFDEQVNFNCRDGEDNEENKGGPVCFSRDKGLSNTGEVIHFFADFAKK